MIVFLTILAFFQSGILFLCLISIGGHSIEIAKLKKKINGIESAGILANHISKEFNRYNSKNISSRDIQ